MKPRWHLLAAATCVAACAANGGGRADEAAPRSTTTPVERPARGPGPDCHLAARDFEVVAAYPHDPAAFTQGLLFDDGSLLESTGRFGQSTVRRVELETGRVLARTRLPDAYFGEGLARLGNRLFQLTWRSGTGFVYSAGTLEEVGRFRYGTEGWGLTTDGERLVMSDGSPVLTFLSADGAERLGHVEVRDGGTPVRHLNELEWIDGHVFANVWYSDVILRIDPGNGAVVDRYDLTRLRECLAPLGDEAVLNGIAHDPDTGRTFVTGKLWPRLFEVRLHGAS